MTADLGLYTLTIAAVSMTPGMCMTLAFTLGMTVGYRVALWMMVGELMGVAVVFSATFWSLTWVRDQGASWFTALSLLGGVYLMYLAIVLFRQPQEAVRKIEQLATLPYQLVGLGFVTAVGNPKGWAFLVALLPRFIEGEGSLLLQFAAMLAIMTVTEFASMSLYAAGGHWFAAKMSGHQGRLGVHRVAATVLAGVSIWVLAGAAGW